MSKAARWRVAAMAMVLLAVVYLSLTSGSLQMSLADIARTLTGQERNPAYVMTLFDYRLPRIVLSMVVGLGLALSGAAVQGIAKNGLADPSILGISAGAGAGVVCFIFFMQGSVVTDEWYSVFVRPVFGWVGGMLAVGVIFMLSWNKGKLDVFRFVLIGIAISAGFKAVTLYFSLKMDSDDFQKASIWLHGSIYNATWLYILSALPWVLGTIPLFWRKCWVLDLIQLRDESAIGLGLRLNRERVVLLLASVAAVSACVAIAGNIAFVGLIAPHVARQIVGVRHRLLLPVSGLMGMLLVLTADYLARNVLPSELPVGIITALVGVPYLLFLVLRRKV